jgi:hypothetical protein
MDFIGKYKKTEMPMYSYESLAKRRNYNDLRSTSRSVFPGFFKRNDVATFFMRFLGVKIGKKFGLNTTDITEFDMVSIGDESMLNEDCGPQTHLFEDRIMKIGSVKIGKSDDH